MCAAAAHQIYNSLKLNHNESDLGQVIVLIMNHVTQAIHGL